MAVVHVVQLIHRLTQAVISCTTTARRFFFPQCIRHAPNLRDEGLVRQWHGESADRVLLEAVVEVAQRLVWMHFEAVVEELGATRRLAVLVPNPINS